MIILNEVRETLVEEIKKTAVDSQNSLKTQDKIANSL